MVAGMHQSLIEKSYEPQHLELERKWTLGQTDKGGEADVTVFDRDRDNTAFLVIECKSLSSQLKNAVG